MMRVVLTEESIQRTGETWDRIGNIVADLPDESVSMIAEAVRAGFEWNFLTESAGGEKAWAQLAPMTQRERAKLGYSPQHPILVRSRSLLYSLIDETHPLNLTEVDRTPGRIRIELGSRDPRFPLLHAGGITEANFIVPARPMTVLGRESIALLREQVIYQVRKQLEGL